MTDNFNFQKALDESIKGVSTEAATLAAAKLDLQMRLQSTLLQRLTTEMTLTDKSLESAAEAAHFEVKKYLAGVAEMCGQASLDATTVKSPQVLIAGFDNYFDFHLRQPIRNAVAKKAKREGGSNYQSAQVAMVSDERLRQFDAQAKAQEAKKAEVMAELERDLQSIGTRQYPARKGKR